MERLRNCLLLCLAPTWLLLGAVQAEEEPLPTYELDETVVTATKIENTLERVPQPVTVISSARVQQRQAYNAAELLDFVPGVRLIRSGSVGASNGISIRSLNGGPASTKTLVLVDGRPVNEAWSGGVNWHAIPPERIDRIEVVRGPGSALYGSQASAGVISIFTRKPAAGLSGWVSIGRESDAGEEISDTEADGYGRPEVSATRLGFSGTYGADRLRHVISLGYRTAQQAFVTPNTNDWGNYDLSYKGNYDHTDDLSLTFGLDHHGNTWDNQAVRSPNEDVDHNYSGDVGARWQARDALVRGRLYFNYASSDNTITSSNLTTGSSCTRAGLMLDYAVPLGDGGTLIVGLDGYLDDAEVDYQKTVVAMAYAGIDSVFVPNARTGGIDGYWADVYTGEYGATSQSSSGSNVALFAQYSRDFGRLGIVGGARLDRQSEFGTILNPKAGLTYEVFTRGEFTTSLKAHFGTAFRAPPMVNLFSRDLGGYGDPDIEPERTRNVDLGMYQRLGRYGAIDLTYFYMDVDDLLINDKAGSTGEGSYVIVATAAGADTLSFNRRKNLGRYEPTGLELGATVYPHRQVRLSGAYTYLDPGDFTFQTSRHRYNLGVDSWVPLGPHRLEGGLVYSCTGEGYFFDFERRPYDGFGLMDANLSFEYAGAYRVRLQARNLADTKYKLWHNAWQPGRSLLLSLEARI